MLIMIFLIGPRKQDHSNQRQMLHGTFSFDTLNFFYHLHQNDKNLKRCHCFVLSAKSHHHFAISPFLPFSTFAFENVFFSSQLCTSPFQALVLLQVRVASSCCCASHLFKLLTLLVLVVRIISLNSYVVLSCWLLLHLPNFFKLMKLLVVVICFLWFFLKLSVVAMHLTSLFLPLGFLLSTLKELHFFF